MKIERPDNILYYTDAYKLEHWRQYPTGTTKVYSVLTARNDKFSHTKNGKVVFMGSAYLMRKLNDMFYTFYDLAVKDPSKFTLMMNRYRNTLFRTIGDDIFAEKWIELKDFLVNLCYKNRFVKHNLTKQLFDIQFVEEGKEYDLQTPLMTIENKHPQFYWLTNFLETIISNTLWMCCTSASTAKLYRDIVEKYYTNHTAEEKKFIDFQVHDFSARGMAGSEAAILSGIGHLQFFKGTDNMFAVHAWTNIYREYRGSSVPATEHSVMCAGGQETELETYERLLDLYPEGIVSIVSDTWDYFGVLNNILPKLKDKILARKGKVVIRPDSGDPQEIIMQSLKDLEKTFECTTDSTGLKMWKKIGLIYGDSITPERADNILKSMVEAGYSPLNIVFGVGSYTYQYVTRDTYSFAIKATSVTIDGVERDIIKNPKTDPGKKSLTGKFRI